MSGGEVEGVIEDAPDHRLPLKLAISITRETCRGLKFAHRAAAFASSGLSELTDGQFKPRGLK